MKFSHNFAIICSRLIRDLLSWEGIHVSKASDPLRVFKLLSSLETTFPCELMRVGAEGDGGYWIPRDLSKISHLFSPGVSNEITFDYEIASKGIPVSMLDPSISAPPFFHPLFSFKKLALSSSSSLPHGKISFVDWFNQEKKSADFNLAMVQMDIEGSEYEVIASMPDQLLDAIGIFVVEFHFLNHLMSANGFLLMEPVISRLLQNYKVVTTSRNFTGGSFLCKGRRFPKMLEVTFVKHEED